MRLGATVAFAHDALAIIIMLGFTIVMIEPMVAVMRFDLGARVKIGDVDPDQPIGTPRLDQAVEFGTRFPATGALLWFSPDGDRRPAARAGAEPSIHVDSRAVSARATANCDDES